MEHVTITDNTAVLGGNIYLASNGAPVLNLKNSIIANAGGGGDCVNAGGTIQSLGYNLDSDNSCNLSLLNNDILATDPLFVPGGPLDYGGSTHSLLLQLFSPALDVIPAGNCALTTDQRNLPRPAGVLCDIGATEVQ